MLFRSLDGETLNPGDVAWEALARLGELTVYPDTDPADFAERVMDADGGHQILEKALQ